MLLLLAACFLPKSDTGDSGEVTDSCGCTDDTGYPSVRDQDGDGYAPPDGDCDDLNAAVHPYAEEICDGIDENCDGQIDEGVPTSWYEDRDGDGFGSSTSITDACSAPAGYVANGSDCNDGDAAVYPGNAEACDGVDNNCDAVIDEGVTTSYYADADADGCGDPASFLAACSPPAGYVTNADDRNDADSTVCL